MNLTIPRHLQDLHKNEFYEGVPPHGSVELAHSELFSSPIQYFVAVFFSGVLAARIS